MLITTLDKEVKIEIPPYAKSIGVMLSGGMDSAVLLFLILKEILETSSLIKLLVFNVPNDLTDARFHSRQVVNFLEKKFSISIKLLHLGDGGLPHTRMVTEPAKLIVETKLVDVLFSGTNQNPPIDVGAQGPQRRNPKKYIPPFLKFPFLDLHKTHILEIYRQFDLLELAAITQSCTQLPRGKCGLCFQCIERQWAFDELKIFNL
jgi:hypothetical protein